MRSFDIDGRRITKRETLGGWMRVYGGVMIPFIVCNLLIAAIRTDGHKFGVDLLSLAIVMLTLGVGM